MIRRVSHIHCIRRHKIHPNATESDFKKRNVYVYSRQFSDVQTKIVDIKRREKKVHERCGTMALMEAIVAANGSLNVGTLQCIHGNDKCY